MGIIGRQVVFDNPDYYRAALTLNVHYKIFMKAQVFICESSEFRLLKNMHKIVGNYLVHRDDSTIMYIGNSLSKIDMLYAWYSICHCGSLDFIGLGTFIEDVHSNNDEVDYCQRKIKEYGIRLSDSFRNVPVLKIFDFKEFHKVARRQKVAIFIDGSAYRMQFKNVRCGNDVEGHIQYKYVSLWVNSRFNVVKSEFAFDKFYVNSNWTSVMVHPHISGNSVCYGNRKSDYELYSKHLAYEFFVDLINETVRSYNPDNPFDKVSSIRGKLSVWENALRGNKTMQEMPIAQRSKQLINHTSLHTCRLCNSFLIPDQRCSNI